jgi:heat-inducible transcriptional repressor
MELTERQKFLLGLIVQEYVETAQPVSSKRLVEKYNLDFSTATVRNEMAALDEAGLIRQPHTSAGRVPTEEGYRLFVGGIMQRPDLPAATQHTIRHQFYQTRQDSSQWMRLAASVLAHQSQAASIVTAPSADRPRFKQVQLIATAGRQVLMVLVMVGGRVSQQMLALSEPVSQERLGAAADRLNALFHGQDADEMAAAAHDLDALGDDMRRLAADELRRSETVFTGEVFHDGWSNVLAEPEFARSDTAQRALRVLEERPLLKDLLEQTVSTSEIGGVQVLIGGEGNWEELSDFSLVLARYGVPDLATGILGVLGPVRMSYGAAISTVNFVAGVLSNLVSETMGDAELPAAE